MADANDAIHRRGRELEKAGARRIGHGFFSLVYTHPTKPQCVVKLARRDGTCDYYRTAQRKAVANPYFPRVYRVEHHTGWYEAELETLRDWRESPESDSHNSERERAKSYLQWRANNPAEPVPSEYRKLPRALRAACNAIAWCHMRDGAARQWTLDLHEGNILCRREGSRWQLVISDPLAHPVNGQAKRFAHGGA